MKENTTYINQSENTFTSYDGKKISYRLNEFSESKLKAVCIHDFYGDSSFFDYLVDYFCYTMIDLYVPDLRGHGKSEGKRGHVEYFDEYLKDIDKLVQIIKDKDDDKVLFITQGIGSLIALLWSVYNEKDVWGIVSSSFGYRFSKNVISIDNSFIYNTLYKIIPGFKYKIRNLNRIINPNVIYKKEKKLILQNFVTLQWYCQYKSFLKLLDNKIKDFNKPILFIEKKDNRLYDYESFLKMFHRIKTTDKKITIHDYSSSDIFITHEEEREELFKEIFDWINLKMVNKK